MVCNIRLDFATKMLVLDHFWGRGLSKNYCNFARTYPFVEILDTELSISDEINRLAGSRSAESSPQGPFQCQHFF